MKSLGAILPHVHSGKVRDTYSVPGYDNLLAMRASDRLSTHNVIHASEIPQKGELLTALTIFWSLKVLNGLPTHLVAWGSGIYDFLPRDKYDPRDHYRTILVQRRIPLPYEFIFRNWLTGSLLKAYRNGEDPYGLDLPSGLGNMAKFEKTLFTPTHKSEHDEPLPSAVVDGSHPDGVELTRHAYELMDEYLATRGIALIDGKFETDGSMLLDEWGTGDCCRMARISDMREGEDPPWLDKEYFRKCAEKRWGTGPRTPLEFAKVDIEIGVHKYHEAFEAITGMSLMEFQEIHLS